MIFGLVSHIQRFSVHDGPGIRTTLFLKGCQMRCVWCHNPETYSKTPEIQLFPDRCIGCAACVEVCAHGGLMKTCNTTEMFVLDVERVRRHAMQRHALLSETNEC